MLEVSLALYASVAVMPGDSDVFCKTLSSLLFLEIAQVPRKIACYSIATGKDERAFKRHSGMVYGKRVDGLIFLCSENQSLVQLVVDEQFPSSFLENAFSFHSAW